MHISCLSLFPEIIRAASENSIANKALEKGVLSLEYLQIRDFAINDYGKVDDALYGGGTGMLMLAEPIAQATEEAQKLYRQRRPKDKEQALREKLIYLSPRGPVLNQDIAMSLAEEEHLILLCGHYEGVDERVLEEYNYQEISIGDYVLSGGELAAAVLIDVVMRLCPGVLPADAWQGDSHSQGFLEENQYSRPAIWRGRKVPEVLLSGHASKIEEFRKINALYNTITKRPDLVPENLEEDLWLKFLDSLT